MHFITFSVVDWIDVFTRQCYRDILLDSLRHCQLQRQLFVHGWCLMSNHIHMINTAFNKDLSDILRDFKKFTSQQIIKAIINNPKESRKEWMLQLFKKHGSANSRNSEFQFWQQDNHPIELFSLPVTLQKLNYIHNNPVAAGIVSNSWEYLYSSAKDYHLGRKCGLIEVEFI
jgi:REP element-mobilizing transposase RayT